MFFGKLTTAKCNAIRSKVTQFPVAFLQHFPVHPIDDKRYGLDFVLTLTNEALTDILLQTGICESRKRCDKMT